MTDPHTAETNLAPCPYCGADALGGVVKITNAMDEHTECCEVQANMVECFAIVCCFNLGGCGASGGYDPDKSIAIERWNLRATTPPALPPIGPRTPDSSMVICPVCTSQFVAIPVDVQQRVAELERATEAAILINNAHQSEHAAKDLIIIAALRVASSRRDGVVTDHGALDRLDAALEGRPMPPVQLELERLRDVDAKQASSLQMAADMGQENLRLMDERDRLQAQVTDLSDACRQKQESIDWARGRIAELGRENQALRNLAENLRPGPISEALAGDMAEDYTRAGVPPEASRGQWEAFANNDGGDGDIGVRIASRIGADEAFRYARAAAEHLNRAVAPLPAPQWSSQYDAGSWAVVRESDQFKLFHFEHRYDADRLVRKLREAGPSVTKSTPPCKCTPGLDWHCPQAEHMKACACPCHKRAGVETFGSQFQANYRLCACDKILESHLTCPVCERPSSSEDAPR